MRLHRLTLTAFGPFAGTETVDFDELSSAGLFLLHGATGAGKTSVLDGVCFALYGGVPGSRPASRLRSDHAEPGTLTEVVLEVTVGGRRLEITRRPEQPRPKKRGAGTTQEKAVTLLREHKGGQWRAGSKSHQEIGEEVKQLVGMSKEQFCQVVLLPQGEFATFLRASASERAVLLRQLFDTRRFKAVEEWLKEQRRAAEQRIEAGDQELLGLAHRMQQAALDDAPPVDIADVLPWAAVLRCTAREQADIAAIALASAEAAHTAAQREADSVRELHALQQQHAEARRQAAVIEGARDERDAERARLARARRAAVVEPALQLREKAARELRTAQEAEADARRVLARALAGDAQRVLATSGPAPGMTPGRVAEPPNDAPGPEGGTSPYEAPHRREHKLLPRQAQPVRPEPEGQSSAEAQGLPQTQSLADAAAGQLTAHERRTREELGSVAAAGQLEQRAAALAAERARLEREAGEDDGRLRDAAAWLDGWEQVKQRHQQRIDAAHAAAARAAGLAAARDEAARLLDAAKERDAHARSLAAAVARHSDARDSAADAREAWHNAREARIAGLAGELAAGLKDGEACRVCGSPDHPDPARPSGRPVTRADEESAYAAYQRADAERETAQQELSHARAGLDAALVVAGDAPVPELAARQAVLEAEHAANEQAAHDVRPAREALEQAEAEHTRRTALRRAAETRAAARTSSRDALDQQLTDLAGQLERARGGFATVVDRRAHLEARADALARTAHAAQGGQESARRLKEADSGLADAAYRAGFDTPEAAAQALLEPHVQQRLEQRVQQWQHEEAAVAADLAEPGLLAAAARPPADPALAQAGAAAATRRLTDTSAGHEAARTRRTELDRLGAKAAARAAELAPARAEYTRLRRLADLAAGTSTENQLRMELETYVLAARLEQVAATASIRLQRMSSGRYTLVHSDARASGRTKSGLGLMAVDSWTGTERDTATLSGGETFFASLALALGLADVVTDEAGGMRLDTLFIDEGFGSLDEQTLDEVLDVLDALRERDRAVGIVSHVADLRQRVPAQLQVVKGQAGSTVRQQTARPPQA